MMKESREIECELINIHVWKITSGQPKKDHRVGKVSGWARGPVIIQDGQNSNQNLTYR